MNSIHHRRGRTVNMTTRPFRPAETIPATRVGSLVVADSPFMLKILAQTLRDAGDFDLVGTATRAHQALRHVSAVSPELVLMDIEMPDLNSIQGTRYMKQREHPPVVILISSHNNPVTKSLAEQAGADGFVSTEVNFRHRLISVLENLFGSSQVRRAAASAIHF